MAHGDRSASQVHDFHHVRVTVISAETVLVVASMRGSHRACGHFGDSGHRLLLHCRPPGALLASAPRCGVDRRQPVHPLKPPGAENPRNCARCGQTVTFSLRRTTRGAHPSGPPGDVTDTTEGAVVRWSRHASACAAGCGRLMTLSTDTQTQHPAAAGLVDPDPWASRAYGVRTTDAGPARPDPPSSGPRCGPAEVLAQVVAPLRRERVQGGQGVVQPDRVALLGVRRQQRLTDGLSVAGECVRRTPLTAPVSRQVINARLSRCRRHAWTTPGNAGVCPPLSRASAINGPEGPGSLS